MGATESINCRLDPAVARPRSRFERNDLGTSISAPDTRRNRRASI